MTLADFLQTQQVTKLPGEVIPVLLGELEQVRAALWTRLVTVSTPRTKSETDLQYLTVPQVAACIRKVRNDQMVTTSASAWARV